MLYIVRWPHKAGLHRAPSKFATWDGVVTDTTSAIAFLVGKRIESAISILRERYGAEVNLVNGSFNIKSLSEIPYDRYHG